MLLILGFALSIGGIVLIIAGVTESPALFKFALGILLLDLSTAVAAAWASQRGPTSGGSY